MTEDDTDEDEITAYELDPDEVTLPKEEIMDKLDSVATMEDIRAAGDILGDRLDDVNEDLERLNRELAEINDTLESNERHIHVIPPDANVSSPIISLELTVAAFALALPGIQLIQGNQVNALSAAIGVALLVHPALSYLRRR